MSLQELQVQHHQTELSYMHRVLPAAQPSDCCMHLQIATASPEGTSASVALVLTHPPVEHQGGARSRQTSLEFAQDELVALAKEIIRYFEPHFENRELSVLNEIRDRLVNAPSLQGFSAPEPSESQ